MPVLFLLEISEPPRARILQEQIGPVKDFYGDSKMEYNLTSMGNLLRISFKWNDHWIGRRTLPSLFLLLILSGCGKESPRPDVEILQYQIGFAGAVDPIRRNLLELQLINGGEDFLGILEVQGITDSLGRPKTEPITYRIDLEVPGGKTAVKEIALPVRPEGWVEALVTLRRPGYSRRFRLPIPPDDGSRLRILAVGERLPDLGAIVEHVSSHLKKTELESPVLVYRALPGELLPQAVAYDPFQLIVLWRATLLEAPPGTIEALAQWVERGGTLVAFPESAGSLPKPLIELLGVVPGDPRVSISREITNRVGPAGSRGFYQELRPAPGATVLQGGLAFRSFRGAGSVTAFSFRPEGKKFPSIEEAPGIYNALCPAVARALSFAGDPGAGTREIERTVAGDLFSLSGFQVPPVHQVLLGIALYLLGGFLLPFFVLKRLRRREWTFLAVVLAAGLATLGIYRWGLLSGLKEPEMEEVTILRIHGDGKRAEATTFLGLISPTQMKVDLIPSEMPEESPLAGARFQPLRGEIQKSFFGTEPIPISRTALHMDASGLAGVSPLTLPPSAMRYIRCDYRPAVDHLVWIEGQKMRDKDVRLLSNETDSLRTFSFDAQPVAAESPISINSSGLVDVYLKEEIQLGNDPILRSILGKILAAMATAGRMSPSNVQGTGAFQFPALQNQETELLGEFHRMQPKYLVGLTRTPFFPGCQEFKKKKAIVVMVVELEPEDAHW